MYLNLKNVLISYGFDSKNAYQNIYINLNNSLKKVILDEILIDNVKLPPSRVLAKDLEISRSTVLKAYDLLVIEKFVKSIPGSGYYVTSKNKNHFKIKSVNKGKLYPTISKRGVAFQKNLHLINKSVTSTIVTFKPSLPPLDIFPTNKWKNLTNKYWGTIKSNELSFSTTNGLKSLRENISNYLKIYRNINCDASQIIITTGSMFSLYLVANALIDKGDNILIENLTYPNAYRLFKSLQAKITPINLHNMGELKNKKAKFFYSIPSNQYYSGIKISKKKRLELLEWASLNNSLIIEDDHEHEFTTLKKPISSIYSLDNEERVIHLGSFNKLLLPSLRLGYMIVPSYLKSAILSIYEQSNRFVSADLQKIMNMFIENDFLNKHLRNIIEITKERKEVFIKHFNSNMGKDIALDLNTSGLNIIGRFKNPKINDVQLAAHLEKNGIITNPLSKYFITTQKQNGLVMGYSCVNNKIIKESIEKMSRAYYNFAN